MTVTVHTRSPDETGRLGELLAAASGTFRPLTVGLSGDLGAGKTRFVRGVVAGIDPAAGEEVCSPTYAICNLYPSVPPVAHFDLYRLDGADDLEGVGFREADEGWRFVEWIERIPEAADCADLRIDFTRGQGDLRTLRFSAASAAGALALAAFAERIAADGFATQPTDSR